MAILIAAFVLLAGAVPSDSAAIWTSRADGTVVNQNLYTALEDVYLNGGPQNPNAAGLADGFYYFMVTDPSGAVLLSLDSIADRALTVANGCISGVGASGGTHLDGLFNPLNLSTPVQLFPYSLTPNPGGVYKVWLTAVGDYSPGPGSVFGFDSKKSDTFKVELAPVPEPASLLMSGFGLLAVLKSRFRKSA